MSALGIVIAQKLIALSIEEKAAVLEFCIGYGCDSPLTKSADAALTCLRAGIFRPAERVTPCTCGGKPQAKKISTFIIRSKQTGRYFTVANGCFDFTAIDKAVRFATRDSAVAFCNRELMTPAKFDIVEDGGGK